MEKENVIDVPTNENQTEEVEVSNTKSNVTLTEPKKNITKANCVNDKIYGPVEVCIFTFRDKKKIKKQFFL